MAQFDISVVGKNLQVFKGSYEALGDFIVQTELLHDLLREEDKEIFIRYVYNFKLTAQVRSVVGRSNKPTTFADMKRLLVAAYPNPKSLQQVLTEFGAVRQGGKSITEFREKITMLAEQLSTFEIDSLENPTQQAKDAVFKVNDSMALNVFMKGVNAEFQSMLVASNPKTLNEAVEKCMLMEGNMRNGENNVFRVWRRENGYNVRRENRNQNFGGQNNYGVNNNGNQRIQYNGRNYRYSEGNGRVHYENRGNYGNGPNRSSFNNNGDRNRGHTGGSWGFRNNNFGGNRNQVPRGNTNRNNASYRPNNRASNQGN